MASVVTQTVKNLPAMQETGAQSLDQEDPLDEEIAPTPLFLTGKFYRGAWRATVHGVSKSRTQLGDIHFHFSQDTLSKNKDSASLSPLEPWLPLPVDSCTKDPEVQHGARSSLQAGPR